VTARQKAGLAALLLLALAVRAALALTLRGAPYFHDPIVDGASYDRWAVEIATRDFWGTTAFFQDALYPYLLGVFYKVFGRDLLWARLAQSLAAVLGLWMLFEAARRLCDLRTAFVALAIGALSKSLAFFDAAILKDFLGVLAVEAALLLWTLDRPWKWAGVGAALGAGCLVRGNLLLVVAAVAGLLALRREWRSAALLGAAAAACILPVTVRNAVVARDFVLTTWGLGPTLYIGNHPENTSGRYRPPPFLREGSIEAEETDFRTEAERRLGRTLRASEVDRYWRGEALSYVASQPLTFLAVTGKRALLLLNAYEVPDDLDPAFMARFSWVLRLPLFTFGLFTMPLAAAGIYLAWQERARFSFALLLLPAYAASILPFFVFGRYRLPLVPVLVLFAAHAVVKSAQLVRWRMSAVPKTALAVFVVAFAAVNLPLPASVGGHRDFRTAHRNLGVYWSRQGRAAEAVEELLAAAALQPAYLQDPSFRWLLGEQCESAGRIPEALEHVAAAAALDRTSAEAAHRAGMIYLGRGMDDRAAAALREALARDPNYAATFLPLAEAERRRGREDEALRVLEAGGRAAPRDAALRVARAEIHLRRGRWAEALAAAEEALGIKPDDPRALEIRREAARRLGR
jgi:tetratricopeptide (TPR) repeat protein